MRATNPVELDSPGASPGSARASSVPPAPATPPRLVSLDAYRGFIMLAMASSGFYLSKVALEFKESSLWRFVGHETGHSEWEGCTFWDLIQPSFMFMVGVALPYSFASRKARGDSALETALHTVYRSAMLVLLGIFLMSSGSRNTQTNFTFVNVLSQIGLGYGFVALLVGRGLRVQGLTIAALLAGTWLLFACYPLPGPKVDPQALGIPEGWERFSGFFAHWNPHTNVAAVFDRWFLNLFPRPEPFRVEEAGYVTLGFIPSMATMAFGVMAGELLRGPKRPIEKGTILVGMGAACLGAGWILSLVACPLVKPLSTPSFILWSTGWTFWLLAAFYWMIDVQKCRRWAFPFVVVGMNSMAIYLMRMLSKSWIERMLKTHLGSRLFEGTYGPIVQSAAVLLVLWLVCLWMYRRKIFLRV